MDVGQVFKKISYSFSANLISLAVSVCMVMFVPKFLSVDDYGLWQLFLFYYSYLGFLAFGWEDGIYLRYAGRDFAALPRKLMASQFYGDFLLQVLLAMLTLAVASAFVNDENIRLALSCAILLSPLAHLHGLGNLIMQATDRIQDYAKLLLTERLSLLLIVIIALSLGRADFGDMYAAKICSILAAAAFSAWTCRSLLRPEFPSRGEMLAETAENIRVGIKLMFANIASMLMIGIVRYGISLGWDVATFGRVSLTLGISNFLMVFISSVSVVFFPIVKRMGGERRAELYTKIRAALTFLLLGLLLCYYPLKCILAWWLPQYADSLIYMSVLFPVCLFESKVDLLTNTYLKSLRQEALMLKLNLMTVILSAIVTIVAVGIVHSLELAVLSIPLLYACRCAICELAVERLLDLRIKWRIVEDIAMAAAFVATGWYMDHWWGTAIYGTLYLFYVLFHRKECVELSRLMKKDRID